VAHERQWCTADKRSPTQEHTAFAPTWRVILRKTDQSSCLRGQHAMTISDVMPV
jgi:hypothetical protein